MRNGRVNFSDQNKYKCLSYLFFSRIDSPKIFHDINILCNIYKKFNLFYVFLTKKK